MLSTKKTKNKNVLIIGIGEKTGWIIRKLQKRYSTTNLKITQIESYSCCKFSLLLHKTLIILITDCSDTASVSNYIALGNTAKRSGIQSIGCLINTSHLNITTDKNPNQIDYLIAATDSYCHIPYQMNTNSSYRNSPLLAHQFTVNFISSLINLTNQTGDIKLDVDDISIFKGEIIYIRKTVTASDVRNVLKQIKAIHFNPSLICVGVSGNQHISHEDFWNIGETIEQKYTDRITTMIGTTLATNDQPISSVNIYISQFITTQTYNNHLTLSV